MNATGAAGPRHASLAANLGVSAGEKLFSTPAERRFVAAVEEGLELVETGLRDEVVFTDPIADATARYLLDAGGKRVRPTLALITAQLGQGNSPGVIAAAQAIEITHLASLYHDDVMDEAVMRRGVPSAQTVWGNSVAILTGDLLFARASRLVAGLGEEMIELQAATFERLCLGQLHETLGPHEGEDAISHYLRVLADKTGSLIAAAAQSGVVLSGAPTGFRDPLTTFGEKIGVAFQLVDDVIDLAPPVGETGKVPGTDLRSGVSTLPLLFLRGDAQSDAAAAGLLARIERDITDATRGHVDDDELTAAIAELRDHEVTRRTVAEAHRWAREAVEAIDPLPDGPAKKALTRFAESIVERSS